MKRPRLFPAIVLAWSFVAPIALHAQTDPLKPNLSLITNRSASSEACGPAAVKWGFMCSIVARHGSNLYAVDFTRPPDVPWDVLQPIEAPVAFRAQQADGLWRSQILESPTRTYQTPTLLLGPQGQANVFVLHPGDGTMYWFASPDATNTHFVRHEINIGWGAYLGGAIDQQGLALMVYWANGASDPAKTGNEAVASSYRRSTIGYTLVDTLRTTSLNGVIDAPGAPYCYSQVAAETNGAHVLTIRSEVTDTLLCGTRNHYTDLRYYHTSDPKLDAKWSMVTIYQDDRSCIQPLGIEVDRVGRVHLLYNYSREAEPGRVIPHRLMYAVSQEPVSPVNPPKFVQHEIKEGGWDGRLFQSKGGKIGILAYKTGRIAEWTEVRDGVAGSFLPWQAWDMGVSQCRVFPISRRGGSTVTEEIEGLMVGATNAAERSSLFHFRRP